MDLMNLLSYLFSQHEDYGEGDSAPQNRYWVHPELGKGEKNYNLTPGNPPVQNQDGWLRSLMPYETGEGGPPGIGQDDGRVHPLHNQFWERFPGLMRGYQKEAERNAMPPPPPDLGRTLIQLEELRQRNFRNRMM